MKISANFGNTLEIESIFRNATRDVALKDIASGRVYNVASNGTILDKGTVVAKPVSLAGFDISVIGDEIHLTDPKKTVIIQSDGQLRAPFWCADCGSIDINQKVEADDPAKLYVGFTIGVFTP